MRRMIFGILIALTPFFAIADNPPPGPRVSIFSTTTDWAALTGLPLRQFSGNFKWAKRTVFAYGLVKTVNLRGGCVLCVCMHPKR